MSEVGKFYYIDGTCSNTYIENKSLHRLDGPAVEYENGEKQYWAENKLHRLDGPALEHANGYKEYWIEGYLHRLDGPAVESPNGDKFYYVNVNDVTSKVIDLKEDIPKYLRMLSI